MPKESYLLEFVNGGWRKYNVKPYVPDPLAQKGDYQIIKPGERMEDGKITPDPGKGAYYVEAELKVDVPKPELLEILPQPWIFLQAFFPCDGQWTDSSCDDECDISLRIIAARKLAVIRHKSPSMGIERKKIAFRLPYDMAVELCQHAPAIAYKYRFIKRDDTGRAWAVDYFPDFAHWQAETESTTHDEAELNTIKRFPVWAGDNISDHPRGYTRSYSIPMTADSFRKKYKEALEYGSTEEYEMGDDSFNWYGPSQEKKPS